jgi:hypothetical protein
MSATLDITYLDAVNFMVTATYANGQKVVLPMSLPTPLPTAAVGPLPSAVAQRVFAVSSALIAPTTGTLDVSVTDAFGSVSGATVSADIALNDHLGADGYRIPLDEANPGHYAGTFASISSPVLPSGFVSDCTSWTSNASKICSNSKEVIDFWVNGGCSQLAALPPPLGPLLGEEAATLCEAAFAAIKSTCAASAFTKGSGGAYLCTAIEKAVDFFSPSGLKFTATASSG